MSEHEWRRAGEQPRPKPWPAGAAKYARLALGFDPDTEIREEDVYSWLEHGVERGYCAPAVCAVHEGVPTTPEEDEEERCVYAVRLYHTGESPAG